MMPNKALKASWLASLGAGLEYYDFIIYGLMASYLGPLFFPEKDSAVELIKTFGVFALGYFVRPLGGILFGIFGDLHGRKRTFLMAMLLMAFSTLAIGLLPTYSQMGVYASFLLITARILQGISFGAELPGAITVVCEYSQRNKQGAHTSYVISSITLGSLLASLVLYIVSQSLVPAQMLAWGWRIPFLVGGILAWASYFIRKHLEETPAFVQIQSKGIDHSWKDLCVKLGKSYQKELILGVGMIWFHASLVIFYLYFPTFLSQYFVYSPAEVYLTSICGIVWSSISLLLTGRLADKIDKKKMVMSTCLGFLFSGFFLFKFVEIHSLLTLIIFMMLYQTFISCLVVSFFPLLANLFPTQVRYSGLAVCYNLAYSIMGCLPMVMTFLTQKFQSPYVGVVFLMLSAGITAASCAFLYKKEHLKTVRKVLT